MVSKFMNRKQEGLIFRRAKREDVLGCERAPLVCAMMDREERNAKIFLCWEVKIYEMLIA